MSAQGATRAMCLAEVLRPGEVVQITDGLTFRTTSGWAYCDIRRRHRNGLLVGAFVDGHARALREADWLRVDHDERGYFYPLASADR